MAGCTSSSTLGGTRGRIDLAYGPIEVIVTLFPGNRFSCDIVLAAEELVASGAIRIIDRLANKDAGGEIK
jgi:hypothetical protein